MRYAELMAGTQTILTLNGGSSSIKFAVFVADGNLQSELRGTLDRISSGDPELHYKTADGKEHEISLPVHGDHSVATRLLDWLEQEGHFASVSAVGHRVVQGMEHSLPERVTPELLADLRRFTALDPDHLPAEIALIEAVQERHPKLPQLACFDTAFHREMPRVAQQLPLPRRYEALGVRRYGFHGLSYAYLMQELERLGQAKGRIILAHLGSGASMAAILDGQCVDTSMGFTPVAGLVMGTRTGDLDPGLVSFLAQSEKMTAPEFNHMVNHESGLLGVSETSSDMRDLLVKETDDTRAAEAVNLFCYQAKKWIGAYAAVLNGLDTLVFSGGIGEHAPPVRSRICASLGYLGIQLDEDANATGHEVISTTNSSVVVRVIHTNEEAMIAKYVLDQLITH
ncbi:acetate/propionate family kinase [soil metagenome]